MQKPLLPLCFAVMLFAEPEVDRIERAVKEITQLRQSLEACRIGTASPRLEGLKAMTEEERDAARLETCRSELEAAGRERDRLQEMLQRAQEANSNRTADLPCKAVTAPGKAEEKVASLQEALRKADIAVARLKAALAEAQASPTATPSQEIPTRIVTEIPPCPPLNPFPKLLRKSTLQ